VSALNRSTYLYRMCFLILSTRTNGATFHLSAARQEQSGSIRSTTEAVEARQAERRQALETAKYVRNRSQSSGHPQPLTGASWQGLRQ
jgi:hypothetical protein